MSLASIVRGSRLGKALGLASLLLVFLVWWQLWGDPGEAVAVRQVPGVIAEAAEKSYLVRLDSGESVRVFRSVNAEVGSRVLLTATRHARGGESFVLTEAGVVSQ